MNKNINPGVILKTELYCLLLKKIGKEEALIIIDYIDQKIEKEVEYATKHLSTKEALVKIGNDAWIKWVVALFIVLAMMIIGLYFK